MLSNPVFFCDAFFKVGLLRLTDSLSLSHQFRHLSILPFCDSNEFPRVSLDLRDLDLQLIACGR